MDSGRIVRPPNPIHKLEICRCGKNSVLGLAGLRLSVCARFLISIASVWKRTSWPAGKCPKCMQKGKSGKRPKLPGKGFCRVHLWKLERNLKRQQTSHRRQLCFSRVHWKASCVLRNSSKIFIWDSCVSEEGEGMIPKFELTWVCRFGSPNHQKEMKEQFISHDLNKTRRPCHLFVITVWP